jgi:serine/threonine protein phosphatase PrpC
MWLFGFLSRVIFLYADLNTNCDILSDCYLLNNRENDTSKLLQKTPTVRSNSSSVYKVDTYALQGSRPYMEDEYFASHDGKVCAIFDGHGGSAVSRYVRSNFYANFQDAIAEYMMKLNGTNEKQGWNNNHSNISKSSELDDNDSIRIKQYKATTNVHVREDYAGEDFVTNLAAHPRNKGVVPTIDACIYALRTAFRNIDEEVLRVNRWSFQGTTAVAILIHDQGDTRKHIISVNIGDSRAVLSRRGIAIDLTTDHKPNDPNEKYRVEQLGGQVNWYGMVDDRTGEPLLDTGVFRINGNLAVSRSLGDRSERPFVSSEPDIKVVSILNDIDEFIVLASDGLFDVISSQEVVSFLHQKMVTNFSLRMQKQDALAKTLAEEAIRRGSLDNISVIIVWLKKY